MIKYHNAYWNSDRQDIDADIIEIDVIWRLGKLKLSHGVITYGDAEEYFKLLNHGVNILCLELKTSNPKAVEEIKYLYDRYNVPCLVDAVRRWYHIGDRVKASYDTGLTRWIDFSRNNNVEIVKKYKSKPWWKRIWHI